MLTGIEENRFIASAEAPRDPDAFVRFLIDQKVRYLIYVKQPGSTLPKVFPDAESIEPSGYEHALHSYSDFAFADIWLFERGRR